MHPSIITGLDGVMYQNFSPPTYGAWNQLLLGYPPYHYKIGGQIVNINPRPPGEQTFFPYLGPNVPTVIRDTVILDITEAINVEFSAISCYQFLGRIASSFKEKTIFEEIIKDEKRHLKLFQSIFVNLTGSQYRPIKTKEFPKTYKEALDFAFHDEQETVDFYLELAHKFEGNFFKTDILRVAHDEQNHAAWFLYLLTKGAKK
ncbi:ferritin family protein [Bacillales bacterium AN1005]